MDFSRIIKSPFLNGLKDWVNVEITNPDSLMTEIQNKFFTKMNPLASSEEKAKVNEKIDMTKYFNIQITEKAKSLLMWGGIGLFLLFLLKRR